MRCYTTLWNINVWKTNKNRQQTTNKTSDQDRGEWSVRCCKVLESSFWISGVLNDVFVSGLPGLVGLPVHPQWATFSSVRVCFGLQLSCLWSLFPVSQIFAVKCPVLPFCSLSSKISSVSSANSILWTYIYKFWISPLGSSLLNGMLHCRYFVTALKWLFTIILSAVVYKTENVPQHTHNLINVWKLVENCCRR